MGMPRRLSDADASIVWLTGLVRPIAHAARRWTSSQARGAPLLKKAKRLAEQTNAVLVEEQTLIHI